MFSEPLIKAVCSGDRVETPCLASLGDRIPAKCITCFDDPDEMPGMVSPTRNS